MAQHPKASFFSEDGYKFRVVVDGKRQNQESQCRVDNVELQNDRAKVKIIFENAEMEDIEKTIQGVDANGNVINVVWVIKETKKGKWILRASSWGELEAGGVTERSVPQENKILEKKPEQQTQVNTQTTKTGVSAQAGETGINMNINMNEQQENMNMGIDMKVTEQNTRQETPANMQISIRNNSPVSEPPHPGDPRLQGYNGPKGCNNPVQDASFNSIKNSIDSKDFEDSKLKVAEQVLSSSCFLVSQVKEIMQLFDFEDTKLDFAKKAYLSVYDQGNYYQVNDEFDFESSIDKLDEYLKNFR